MHILHCRRTLLTSLPLRHCLVLRDIGDIHTKTQCLIGQSYCKRQVAHVQVLMFILTNEIKSQLFRLSVENSFQIAKIDAWILAPLTNKKKEQFLWMLQDNLLGLEMLFWNVKASSLKLPQILNLKTTFGSQEGKNAATSW